MKSAAEIADNIVTQTRAAGLDLANGLLVAVAQMGEALSKMRDELAELKRERATSLADSYRGGWQPGNRYARGSLTTYSGSLWIALEDAEGRPGESTNWRMIVRGSRSA